MRRLGGVVVLLGVAIACAPIKAAQAPAEDATAEAGAEADGSVAATEPQPAPAAASADAPAAEAPFLAVRDVKVEPVGAGRRLTIGLSRAPEGVRNFTLNDPPRLVMDLRGPQAETAKALTRFPLTDDLVARVRVATNGPALRVVADLQRPLAPHSVRQEGNVLIADLGDTGQADATRERVVPAAAIASEPLGAATLDPKAEAAPAKPEAETEAPEIEARAPAKPAEVAAVVAPPPPALAPEPIAPVRRVATLSSDPTARQYFTGQRISLDFKDADIQNVLRVLADVSGLNIIATDDVKGKVTLHLTDVPWDQALDLVLRSNRLEKTHEGNVVRISTVARLKEEREALRAAQEAERELEALRVKYVRVNYARADEALIDKVKGVLTDRGSVTFDDRTNTIIVRDIARGIDDATQLVHELDVQSPQVLIEANIVEATEDFARALGVQWGYRFTASALTGNPTGMNFPGTVGIGGSGLGVGSNPPAFNSTPKLPVPFLADFPVPSGFGSGFGPGTGSALDVALGSVDGTQSLSTRLTALEEAGKGKVISRPRVITMNNVAATIQSLTILRVKLPSTGTVINTGTGGAAGSASTATEKINTGITLVVTPQISADGFVLMNIFAKSSQPDFTKTVDGIPNEVSREANSNVLIPNGETVVLGGIFRNTSQDNESGLPWLRSIPVLGWAFKRQLRTNHHEELLVFLTPRILASGTAGLPRAERLWEERRQGG